MMRDLLRMLVPRDWTGAQALLAARLLRQAADAVWEVHGEEMAAALGEVPVRRWHEFLGDDPADIDDDDIPF